MLTPEEAKRLQEEAKRIREQMRILQESLDSLDAMAEIIKKRIKKLEEARGEKG